MILRSGKNKARVNKLYVMSYNIEMVRIFMELPPAEKKTNIERS